MSNASIAKSILEAIKPPSDWSSLHKNATIGMHHVHALICGGAASLIQCSDLLTKPNSIGLMWKGESLYANLKSSVDAGGSIHWDDRQVLRWSAGYFLNRAQHNVASALDRCINVWLAYELEMSESDLKTDNTWIQTWPAQRLKVLSAILRDDPTCRLLKKLHAGFGDWKGWDGEGVWLEKSSKTFRRTHWPVNLRVAAKKFKTSPVHSLVFVVARHNAFKHRVQGTADRDRIDYVFYSEFFLTYRALGFVADIWRALIGQLRDNKKALRK